MLGVVVITLIIVVKIVSWCYIYIYNNIINDL